MRGDHINESGGVGCPSESHPTGASPQLRSKRHALGHGQRLRTGQQKKQLAEQSVLISLCPPRHSPPKTK